MTYYLKIALILLIVTVAIAQPGCQPSGSTCSDYQRCCGNMRCRSMNGMGGMGIRTCQRTGGGGGGIGGGGGGNNCQPSGSTCSDYQRCCGNMRCRSMNGMGLRTCQRTGGGGGGGNNCQPSGSTCSDYQRCCGNMRCRSMNGMGRRTCQRTGGGGGGGGNNCKKYNQRCKNNGGNGMRCCNNLRCRRNYCDY